MNELSIFCEALEIGDLASRSEFLDRACGYDTELRDRVESLLAESSESGEFLKVPVLEQLVHATGATSDPVGIDVQNVDFDFLLPPVDPTALGLLGHYDVLEFIGRGACGIVFKAFDRKLHRLVAIKVLMPRLAATEAARSRFLQEARAAAAVRHENVIHIYAVEEAPVPYLVMEHIEGPSLERLLKDAGSLKVERVVEYGRMIAVGLVAAHEKGLIHRDVKPGNLLIEEQTGRIKLTDFGLVRSARESDLDDSLCPSDTFAGTPLFMSPEQARGLPLDQRSDLFSLGSVLYVMACGQQPFASQDLIAVLAKVANEAPRDVRDVEPQVPERLANVIRNLHAKDPAKRYSSGQEVVAALADCLDAPPQQVTLAHESTAPVVSRARSRPSVIGIAILLALVGLLGVTEATGITSVRSTVIRLFSPEGTLVVEVDDPEITISVDEEEIVIAGAGVKELRLSPGQYHISASKDGELLRREVVTITKNGRQVLRMSRESNGEQSTPALDTTTDPDRRAAEYVLSIGGKVWINKDSAFTDDNGISSIDQLPTDSFRLTHADLRNNTRVSDAGLEAFRGTTNLYGIYLTYASQVGDAGVASLSGNTKLREIHLWGTKVTGKGLESLQACSDVIDLYLGATRVTDRDMKFFRDYSGLKGLRCIMLSELPVTDDGLASLSGAERLGQIHLEGTQITDAGLLHLARCSKLGAIYAERTNLTPAGIARFRSLQPNCRVYWEPTQKVGPPDSPVVSPTPSLWKPDASQQEFFDDVSGLSATEQVVAVSRKLREINPGFDGNVADSIESGQVVGLSFNGDFISQIWPVRALPKLTSLKCVGTHLTYGTLSDLSPLSGMPLTDLDIGNSSVADLSPLKGMRITHLYCANIKVEDLSPVAEMPLQFLSLWSCSRVTDLRPLKGLPLKTLICDFTCVADLAPLRGMQIARLHLNSTPISDLTSLLGMPLKELDCSNTQVVNLSPLRASPLNVLHIENTPVFDLSFLEGTPLTQLSLSGSLVSDLQPLVKLPLEQLSLSLPLFHEKSAKLIAQIPIKRLGWRTDEIRDAAEYWHEFTALKSAAEKFAAANIQLPAEEQSAAILKSLRNESPEVNLTPVVETGVIKKIKLTLSPESHDLSSLRILNSLHTLSLSGGPDALDLSPILDLPVETLECSKRQALKNATILKEMPQLMTINGTPAHKYLAEIALPTRD